MRVRALFVQLRRKRCSADFIVFRPTCTRKWKIKLTWHIFFFLSLSMAKRKNRIQKSAFFLKKANKTNSVLFPFSEESTKRIQNDGFLFPFFTQKQNRKLDCLHPPGSLSPRLFLHANGAWERGYPPGVSNCTWLVTFDRPMYAYWLPSHLMGEKGVW